MIGIALAGEYGAAGPSARTWARMLNHAMMAPAATARQANGKKKVHSGTPPAVVSTFPAIVCAISRAAIGARTPPKTVSGIGLKPRVPMRARLTQESANSPDTTIQQKLAPISVHGN